MCLIHSPVLVCFSPACCNLTLSKRPISKGSTAEELHANEIVLLAYYIAAVNIEEAYRGERGEDSDLRAV